MRVNLTRLGCHATVKRMEIHTDALSISERVRRALAADDRSGRWLARQLNKTPAWVQRRLTGDVEWSADDIAQVAAVLGIPVGAFFGEVAA